ncbi:unnamed protein product [Cunninghamella blakesleeana]
MNQVIEETKNEALQAFEEPYVFENPIQRVAVIGTGPSGLVAAKALKEKGFDVHIYDRGDKVGGNWAYNHKKVEKPFIPSKKEDEQFWTKKETEPLPDYVHTEEPIVITPEVEHYLLSKHHPPSACYEYLVNNTLTPVLRSLDLPWPSNTPDIVSHTCVQQYYEDYVNHFDLLKHIQFHTSLNHLEKRKLENGKDVWELTLIQAIYLENGKKVQFKHYKESFDAVVLATGEFHTPFVPYYDGLYEFNHCFPGKIEHSKQFTRPEIHEKKKILIVGGNVSSIDILNMLTVVDCEVYLSIRGPLKTNVFIIDLVRSLIPKNTIIKPAIECFYSRHQDEKIMDGTIRFTDGTEINDFDHIIFATGYLAPYSYLGSLRRTIINDEKENDQQQKEKEGNDDDTSLFITTNSKKILNTYKDIFLINDPTLTFMGTTKHLSTVLFFDYQAQAIARVWSQQARLPNKKLMKQFNESFQSPCPLASYEGEHERLRVENIVPWLNTHAEKLNLNLPSIKSLPNFVVEVNQRGFDNWSTNGARFVHIIEKRKKELNDKLNIKSPS